jgi:hypothetical protein
MQGRCFRAGDLPIIRSRRDRTGMVGISIDQKEMLERIVKLRTRHSELDGEVDALTQNGVVDQLKYARMKKDRLRIKDEISTLEDQLTPDIIA